MAVIRLRRHPSTPCAFVDHFEVRVERRSNELQLAYSIHGEIRALAAPRPAPARRRDDLWKHTCCESFLKARGGFGYHEFNFAPSTGWALYRFTGYREGLIRVPYPGAPKILVRRSPKVFELEAHIDLKALALTDTPLDLGLSGILESHDGSLSYWAIHHPSTEPDFHHPETFACSL